MTATHPSTDTYRDYRGHRLAGAVRPTSPLRLPFAQATPQPAAAPPRVPVGQDGFVIRVGERRLPAAVRPARPGRRPVRARRCGRADQSTRSRFRRLRPYLRGRFARRFEFMFIPDFAGGTLVVQDAYLDTRLLAGLPRPRRQGQDARRSRASALGDSNLLFFERALPTCSSRIATSASRCWATSAGGDVSYLGGVMNGVADGGSADVDTNDGKDVAGRFIVRPFNTRPRRTPLRGLGLRHRADRTGSQAGAAALPVVRTPIAAADVLHLRAAPSPTARGRATRRRPSTTTRRSAGSPSTCTPNCRSAQRRCRATTSRTTRGRSPARGC